MNNQASKGSGEPVTRNNDRLNTVETVFSKETVKSLENILYDYWNNFYGTCFAKKMMSMLTKYIKHYSYGNDDHWYEKPDGMCEFVSSIIQLNEWLSEITSDERPCSWEDTKDGWRLPVPDNQTEK